MPRNSERRPPAQDGSATTPTSTFFLSLARADAMRRGRHFALAGGRRLRTATSVLTLPSLRPFRTPPLARKPQTFRLQSWHTRVWRTHTYARIPYTHSRGTKRRGEHRGAHKERWLVLVYPTPNSTKREKWRGVSSGVGDGSTTREAECLTIDFHASLIYSSAPPTVARFSCPRGQHPEMEDGVDQSASSSSSPLFLSPLCAFSLSIANDLWTSRTILLSFARARPFSSIGVSPLDFWDVVTER